MPSPPPIILSITFFWGLCVIIRLGSKIHHPSETVFSAPNAFSIPIPSPSPSSQEALLVSSVLEIKDGGSCCLTAWKRLLTHTGCPRSYDSHRMIHHIVFSCTCSIKCFQQTYWKRKVWRNGKDVLASFKSAHLLKPSMFTNRSFLIFRRYIFIFGGFAAPDLNTKYKYAMPGGPNTSALNNEALWGVQDGILILIPPVIFSWKDFEASTLAARSGGQRQIGASFRLNDLISFTTVLKWCRNVLQARLTLRLATSLSSRIWNRMTARTSPHPFSSVSVKTKKKKKKDEMHKEQAHSPQHLFHSSDLELYGY